MHQMWKVTIESPESIRGTKIIDAETVDVGEGCVFFFNRQNEGRVLVCAINLSRVLMIEQYSEQGESHAD